MRWLAELELDRGSTLQLPPDMCWKELCWEVLSYIADCNGSPIKNLAMNSCLHVDGRISWAKLGVFHPEFDNAKILCDITHKKTGTKGVIPGHVKISKEFYSLVMNHNEHKAFFEHAPHKIPCCDFFTKGALKDFKKGGSPKLLHYLVEARKKILEDRMSGRAQSSSGEASSTWMKVLLAMLCCVAVVLVEVFGGEG